MTVSRDADLENLDHHLETLWRQLAGAPRRRRRDARLMVVAWVVALSVMVATYLTLLQAIEVVGRR
jgi:hypothetical protein